MAARRKRGGEDFSSDERAKKPKIAADLGKDEDAEGVYKIKQKSRDDSGKTIAGKILFLIHLPHIVWQNLDYSITIFSLLDLCQHCPVISRRFLASTNSKSIRIHRRKFNLVFWTPMAFFCFSSCKCFK